MLCLLIFVFHYIICSEINLYVNYVNHQVMCLSQRVVWLIRPSVSPRGKSVQASSIALS